MTRRVVILRPPEDGIWAESRWPDVLRATAEPLEAHGLAVEHRSWLDSPDSLSCFDLILPLLVWGYHLDGDWPAQVARWREAGLPLQNPVGVLAWNADKQYLARLEQQGVPIVPTLFVPRLSEQLLGEAAQRFGVGELIAKPTVSAGAYGTIRWSPGGTLDGGPTGSAMIQPYLTRIETAGEISLIYFGGRFSHAVRKVPQPGDFRVQPEFDGVLKDADPEPDETAVAEAVLRAVDEVLLYARVDLVRGQSGEPLLMELELIEPDLFLRFDAAAPGRFGAAVADCVRRHAHVGSRGRIAE